jgi:phosphatidylglycerophosphate synthase
MGVGQEREKVFDNMAWWLHRHKIRPDHISFLQVPVYAAMIYTGFRAVNDNIAMIWIFGWLQVLAFLIDGADGILARRTGTVSRRGHLLDEIFDIAGIGITIWIVSMHHGDKSQWLFALLMINFFVYIQNEIQGTKSITYTRGPLTIGFVFEYYYPGVLSIGIALPLIVGVLLLFSRVAWRKRIWAYYQYFTAGLRKEYKRTPREQRESLVHHPTQGGTPWPTPRRTTATMPMPDRGAEETTEPETPPPS